MARPMTHEVNIEKNIDVIREMNDAEYEQHLLDVAEAEEQEAKRVEEQAAAEAKKAAKEEALAALGLSQEIINLLAD